MKSLKKLLLAISVLLLAVMSFVSYDVYKDRKHSVTISGVTKIYESFSEIGIKESGTLAAGESVKVLRIRYGKDFQAVEVESADKKSGWLTTGETAQLREP